MEVVNHIMSVISDNKAVIGTVLGILFAVAKAFSNEKAGPVVSKIQAMVDVAAKIVSKCGELLAAISEILANVIKSDGFLGKK